MQEVLQKDLEVGENPTEENKMTFKKGDKFILELGEERKMFKEFQIAGTDLYVKKDLLEKLTPYKPGNLNIEHKSDDEQDLISRQCAIDTAKRVLGDYEITRTLQTALHILPSVQPVLTCDGCRFVGTYDTDFPCNGCVRREKDYYDPER